MHKYFINLIKNKKELEVKYKVTQTISLLFLSIFNLYLLVVAQSDLIFYTMTFSFILLIPSKFYYNVSQYIKNIFIKTENSLNNKLIKILDKIDYEKSISTNNAKELIYFILDIKLNHSLNMIDYNLLTKSFLLLNFYSKNNTETVNTFDYILYSLSFYEDSSTNYNTSKIFDILDNDKSDILFHQLFINNSDIFKKYYNTNQEYMNNLDSQFNSLINNISTNDLTDTNVKEDLLKKFKINNSTLKMYSSN